MEFQRLRLTGFKSFVEPTDFEIRPGLTGIVGPNGCGKSNLLEALRWVMGATSAKALRAGGMEDVIFAGSGTAERTGRPPRQWAEVALQIGNETRTAPDAYNDQPLIEVSRRITKKAEGTQSTYRINGKEVRAKDVQLLFADGATGANSPALVRQGQVSDLINAKPENRRKFLEEAAGVAGLYTRRHEAELRLKGASQNLERLDDVLGELEQQRGQLARQARQAVRYRTLSENLKKTEALLAYSRWADARDALEGANAQLEGTRRQLEEAARAAASATAERERAHEALPALRKTDAEAAAALHRLTVEQETYERELIRAEEEIERLRAEKDRLDQALVRERDLGADAAEALDRIAADVAALEAGAAAETEALAALGTKVTEAETAFSAAEKAAAAAQAQYTDAKAERSANVSRVEAATRAQQSAEAELARLRDDLAQFESDAAGEDDAPLKSALATAETALTAATTERERLRADLAEAEAAADALSDPRDQARAATNALQAEVDTLTRILKQSEPEGVSLADRISVAPGVETAFAAALPEALALGDDPEADRYWSALGAMPADLPSLPAGATPLADEVSAPDLLHRRLAMIGVVSPEAGPDLAQHLVPGQCLVSTVGDIWRWDGYVAKAGAKTAEALWLERKRELAEKETALAAAFTARDDAESAFADARHIVTDLKASLATARSRAEAADRERLTAERALAKQAAEAERRAAKGEALLARRNEAAARLQSATQALQTAQTALDSLPDLDAAGAQLGRLNSERDQARQALGRLRGQRADLQRDRDSRQARLTQLIADKEGWERRAATAVDRTGSVSDTLNALVDQLAAAERRPEDLATRRTSLFEAVDRAEADRRRAADALAEALALQEQADAAARLTAEAVSVAREVKAREEALRDAARDRLSEMASRAHELHEGDPDGLLTVAGHDPDTPLPDQTTLEEKVDKLKRDRDSMGGVNLCAEQEMTEIDDRLSDITRERADCEEAIAKLRGAIGSLNRDGRQRLLDAFKTVNTNFQALFSDLFGGGSAELRLVDSDDPLEAGLDIFASPPGKKLTSMSLMSGGEQALTATALIFAVFKANPAPVCVLDEVDAPLDDANTDRFCAMLAKMAAETETRFIAITHHPLTMSRMDRLYGVTMIERGVSQLVSVDLEQAEKLAA
ncbi:chromosome segregation protein [Parvularcula bermudensis HTCC2503]|uniref:Chromosome partition protein Smc n=1 Tax=Parvularcula bermudensis (strain ATCC BAA-594 / HTCC2503 / KCTC 12087) TaxID=314260 RepID=E0TC69_PARBH|nr:chromosome segregation protein SMC [Parvularcula bermudensis]ADM08502.1 chromosome segregation protein [Parvularcula bermudensis HTCC2503]